MTTGTLSRLLATLLVVSATTAGGALLGDTALAQSSGSLTDDTLQPGEDVFVNNQGGEVDKHRPRRFVDRDRDSEPPVTVYVDETVNISSVKLNGTDQTIGSGSVTLRAIDDRSTATVEGENADFAGIATGLYSADENDSAELLVRRPTINGLSLYETKDEEDELVNGTISGDTTLYLNPEWNFDDADALELTITDPDGLEVTGQILDPDASEDPSNGASVSVAEGFAVESGKDIALNFTGRPGGTYTISAEGSDFGPSQSVAVTLNREPASLGFERNPVVRGDTAVVNVSGLTGQTVYVRVDAAALDELPSVTDSSGDVTVTNETAETVFYGANVTRAVGGDDLNLPAESDIRDDLIVELTLDSNGEARFGVRTKYLRPRNSTFRLATTPPTERSGSFSDRLLAAETVDERELLVLERNISVTTPPDAVPATSEFVIEGTATGVDHVAVYIYDDDAWVPAPTATGSDDNVVAVTDGRFAFEAAATGRLALPDAYRIGLVDPDELDSVVGIDATEPDERVTNSEWRELQTAISASIRTSKGNLSARLGSDTYPAGPEFDDDIVLTGEADGQGDHLRFYIIDPRGTVHTERVTVDSNGSIRYAFGTKLDRQGSYRALLVGRGRDGEYGVSPSAVRDDLTSAQTPEQKFARIRDLYSGAGIDDAVVTFSFIGVDPLLEISSLGRDGRVPPTRVEIRGISNRDEKNRIYLEVLDSNQTLVDSATASINGTADTWHATLDFTELPPGNYTVRAVGPDSATSRTVELVDPVTAVAESAPAGESTQPDTPRSNVDPTTEPVDDSQNAVPGIGFRDAVLIVIGLFIVLQVIAVGLLAWFRLGANPEVPEP